MAGGRAYDDPIEQDVPLNRTPDFYTYAEVPLAEARADGEFIVVGWPDGATLRAHVLWLWENRMAGAGVDEATREGIVDPASLPVPSVVRAVSVEADGDLRVRWHGAADSVHHSGWLRHVADGGHRPRASIPEPTLWTADDLGTPPAPPTMHGPTVLDDPESLQEWLSTLCRYGLARLEDLPTTEDVVARVGTRIGVLRDTNFGITWSVSVDVDPNSTANTARSLPPHTDLPTRETPPGFQLLHCVVNTCRAGLSHMADGYAVVEHLRHHEPDAYDALTTLRWIFFNRSPDHDHRWSGPIIDVGGPGRPLTLRAFHPVRAFPDMDDADVPRAYAALRTFGSLAASPGFRIEYPFRPGDLVAFDNRRILHGRGPIDTETGVRELRGAYIDHDEIHSRLRVLTRGGKTWAPSSPVR